MAMEKDGVKTFYAKDRAAWRAWLAENHAQEKSVWLIIYKKASGIPSIYYDQAVDEALCFGWIDSKPNKRDDQSFYQFFAKRNPKSNWSGVNKKKVEKLLKEKLMTEAGLAMIEIAQKSGTWTALDEVNNLAIPEDMQIALDANPQAKKYFDLFPPSTKRGILEWIASAKQPETRGRRIRETVALAEENERANQYKRKSP
jgi:uncharacterized protein YdeI (YjbR/CyaY-like superfamily)